MELVLNVILITFYIMDYVIHSMNIKELIATLFKIIQMNQ